jgi:uncharacterized membrane protein YeaQ/YmgE (transglycosylase-associated protein family)
LHYGHCPRLDRLSDRGWIFTQLRIGTGAGGFLYSLAAATLGAVVLVAIVHLFVGDSRP